MKEVACAALFVMLKEMANASQDLGILTKLPCDVANVQTQHDSPRDSSRSSLLAVNVHQLQLKVTVALLVGTLKQECDRVSGVLCLQSKHART